MARDLTGDSQHGRTGMLQIEALATIARTAKDGMPENLMAVIVFIGVFVWFGLIESPDAAHNKPIRKARLNAPGFFKNRIS